MGRLPWVALLPTAIEVFWQSLALVLQLLFSAERSNKRVELDLEKGNSCSETHTQIDKKIKSLLRKSNLPFGLEEVVLANQDTRLPRREQRNRVLFE